MAVDYTDVEVSLGRALSTNEVAQVQMWLGDALVIIGNRLGDVAALDQTVLDYVVREAVVLKIRRPDPATQVQVSVDDATTSRTYESSTGQVTILDEWWAMLSPAADSGIGFSTRPAFEPDAPAQTWFGWETPVLP
jgi:hypothetical protein